MTDLSSLEFPLAEPENHSVAADSAEFFGRFVDAVERFHVVRILSLIRSYTRILADRREFDLSFDSQEKQMKRVAEKQIQNAGSRSRTLDRTRGRSLFLADGSVKSAADLASESLVSWLNGWEPAERDVLRFPEQGRQRIIEREYGGSVVGKRSGMDDHTPESQARIVDLLNYVRSAVDVIWNRAREHDKTWVRQVPPPSEELRAQYYPLGKARGGLPPVDWPPELPMSAVEHLNRPDSVLSFDDMGG